MRKVLTILTLFCTLAVTTVRAQYVRVNVDAQTIAAMSTSFGTESVAEVYYKSQIKDILDHYTTAEVAAAGIFSSKYLDRKALTDLGILSDRPRITTTAVSTTLYQPRLCRRYGRLAR